jgi:hypothetical protein
MGSGPAFAFGDVVPVRTQPIFAPLQSDLRFFLLCCPHRRRNILRCTYPLRGAIWIYPVPLERRGRLGPPLTPTVLVTHDGRNPSNPCSLQEEPRSILGSFRVTTLNGHLCILAIPPSLAPSPRYARRYTVSSRLQCHSYECGYIVQGLRTDRYLPALPCRLRVMGHTV